MKIRVTEEFGYEEETYTPGDKVNLPESVAKSVIKKGYGEKVEEETPDFTPNDTPDREKKDSSKGKGPIWSKDIPIQSQKRNLQLVIWGGDDISIALEEGRKSEEDSWENKRTYIPVAKTFELAERLKEAGRKVRDMEEV